MKSAQAVKVVKPTTLALFNTHLMKLDVPAALHPDASVTLDKALEAIINKVGTCWCVCVLPQ